MRVADPRARRWAVGLGLYVLLYLSWQLLDWAPGSRENVGDLLLLPLDLAAVYAAWRASVRSARSRRLRAFWRLMAVAFAAEAVGDLVQAIYDIALHHSPYPSLADPFYLAFYPLLLLALFVAFRGKRLLKTTLDGATIVVGGGALVWYLVLGPTIEQTQGPLTAGVSVAFPIGDLFLLAGLAAMLLQRSEEPLRVPLQLIAVAVALGIVADVLYGYGQLHGIYRAGEFVDALYALEFATFAIAAASQSEFGTEASAGPAANRPQRARASWVPYLSVAVGLGVLLGVERGRPFFPDVSLIVIVVAIAVLVGARQYVAQRELVQTQEALRRSERVKDEFLSVVGHELRTPLTSIRGSLGLLHGGVLGRLPPDATNMVAMAVLNTDRLVRLVNDILDVERMAAGRLELEPAPVDAVELVSQAMGAMEGAAEAAGVTLCGDVAESASAKEAPSAAPAPSAEGAPSAEEALSTEEALSDEEALRGAPAPIIVAADPDRIVQVLVNLIGNAVKFSDRGDRVTVVVGRRRGWALFSVTDTGRGIPADKLEGIFERFGQVDASDAREKGGSGLGLAIARGIVEQHGGEIWAESREGEGSTFRFTLPLAARDSANPRPARRPKEMVGA